MVPAWLAWAKLEMWGKVLRFYVRLIYSAAPAFVVYKVQKRILLFSLTVVVPKRVESTASIVLSGVELEH